MRLIAGSFPGRLNLLKLSWEMGDDECEALGDCQQDSNIHHTLRMFWVADRAWQYVDQAHCSHRQYCSFCPSRLCDSHGSEEDPRVLERGKPSSLENPEACF